METTYKKSELSKAAKVLRSMTSTLTQILKQLNGLYKEELVKGMTVDQFFAAYGIVRAKGKAYEFAQVKGAWNENMKINNDCAMFKNKTATYVVEDGETIKTYKVYTRTEAEKIVKGQNGSPIRITRLTEIDKNAWSIKVLTDGLKQGANYDKESKKAQKSEDAFVECEEYCIIKERTLEAQNGETATIKSIETIDYDDITLA